MTDLEVVTSLEQHMEKWLSENCDDLNVGWFGPNLSRHMAISIAQMLWAQREASEVAEEYAQ